MKKGLWLKMIFLGWGQCAPSFIQCFGTVCWVTERTAIHEKKTVLFMLKGSIQTSGGRKLWEYRLTQ